MTCVLVDERISEQCRRSLTLHGFYPISLPPHPALPPSIASHPDSLVFYKDKTLFVPGEYCEVAPYVFTDIREIQPEIKICFTGDSLGDKYPLDCKMNALCIGKRIYARLPSLSESIRSFAKENGYETVNTAQGYPACTTLALDEKHVITADHGLKKLFSTENIRVTLIENGDISLPPYEYGFIGGASGVYENKVYFLGDLCLHKNAESIENAIKSAGFLPISLSSSPLADLGGLVFLK